MADYYLGIEQSGSQLKIAAFKKTAKNYVLTSLDRLSLQGSDDQSADIIHNWVNEKLPNAEHLYGYVTIPESSIYMKELEIPFVKDSQIFQTIHWELVSSSPIPLDDAVIEWKKLSQTKNLLRVLVFVMRSSIADQIITIFEKAGVSIEAIEPSSLAFMRIAKADFSQNTLLMTVEEEETNLLILSNGMPVFTTSVSINLKRSAENRRRLSNEIIEDLAENAKRIIDFWQNKQKDIIRQVVITGDVANKYYGLAKAINIFAQVPVVLALSKKVKDIHLSGFGDLEMQHNFIPIGAFLRTVSKDNVTLLPKVKKQQIEKKNKEQKLITNLLFFSAINSILLIITLITFALLIYSDNQLKREVIQNNLFVQNHPAQKYLTEVTKVNSQISSIQNLLLGQKDTGARLSQISANLPLKVNLTSVELGYIKDQEQWKVKGIGNRQDILAFYKKLQTAINSKEITMLFSSLEKEQDQEFEIDIIW